MDQLGDQDLGVYGESLGCKPTHMDGVGKTLGTVIGRRVSLTECLRTHWRIVYEARDPLGTVAMDLPIRLGTSRA